MNRRALTLGLGAALLAQPARAAGVSVAGVVVDPLGRVRPDLLSAALRAWKGQGAGVRDDQLAIADFAKPSRAERFHMLNLKTGAVTSTCTAHGKGSDPAHRGWATFFSNDHGSNASSLGAYVTAGRYNGRHGLSLRLKGLEPTNDAAEARAIVLHSADYMAPDFVARHGKPGRSFGCFVVEAALIETVVSRLEGGVLLFAGR